MTKDLQRYKDLLGLREKEVESLKTEYRRLQKSNDELRHQLDAMQKDFHGKGGIILRDLPLRSATAMGTHTTHIYDHSASQGVLEELSYHQNTESQTTDLRGKKQSFISGASNILNG